MNVVALMEWIAQPQGSMGAMQSCVSEKWSGVHTRASWTCWGWSWFCPDKKIIPSGLIHPCGLVLSCFWCDFSLSKVVSFLWEMSNLVLCVWPGEKRTWEPVAFGRWDTVERKPLARVTVCGNHHSPSLSLRKAGTWGEDPEAMSLRERESRMLCAVNYLGFLVPLLIPNL